MTDSRRSADDLVALAGLEAIRAMATFLNLVLKPRAQELPVPTMTCGHPLAGALNVTTQEGGAREVLCRTCGRVDAVLGESA